MREHSTFGQTCGATGVLQKGNVVQSLRHCFEIHLTAGRNGLFKGRHLVFVMQRQFKLGHHLGQMPYSKCHPSTIKRTE